MFKKIKLSKVLAVIGFALTAGIGAHMAFADNGAPTMPVEIINNTGIADASHVYVLIKGNAPGQTNDCFMQVDESGSATCVQPAVGEDSSKYAFTLASLPKAADGVGYSLSLPETSSGRMVFSLNYPTSITVVKNDLGQVKIPDPDGFNPQDANYNTLYDKVEFTFENGIWINPTAVDFFSIPIRIENANSTLKASGFYNKRSDILKNIQATITGGDKTVDKTWNNLFVTYQNDDNTKTILRVVSPGKALTGGKVNFDNDYLTGKEGVQQFRYISNLQQYYRTNKIIVDCSEIAAAYPLDNYLFVGQVNQNGDFVFTNQTGSNSYTIPAAVLNTALFFGGNTKAPGFKADNNTPGGVIVKFISAAFDAGLLPAPNNAVLSNDYLQGLKKQYYTVNPLLPKLGQTSGPWFDLYAQAMHAAGGVDQPIYAFAYDDTLGQDGTLMDPNPTPAVTKITLGDMTGTTIPDPYADNSTYNVQFGIPGNEQGQYQVNMINKDGTKTALYNGVTYSVTMPLHLEVVYYHDADINIYLKNSIVKPSLPGIVIDKSNPDQIMISLPGPPAN